MRLGYGLNVEQSQKLIMTPELRQAITVLQLSSMELSLYIEQQMEINPLLEIPEGDSDREEDSPDELKPDEQEPQNEFDPDWEEYFHDSSDLGVIRPEKGQAQRECGYESLVSRTPTLTEHLLWQLQLSTCSAGDMKIGEYLIGNIDERGYLQITAQEVASHLKVAIPEVNRVLELIQGFDPPGVGARNLSECLLIQVNQLGINNTILNQLVSDYLLELSKGKLNWIAQMLNVPVREVQQAADVLKTLDPKPGRNFTGLNDTRYIVPDIFIEKVEGQYFILINDSIIPRITINSTYRSILNRNENYDNNTRRFVESKLNAAAWLIKSIEQRRLTLYKVAKCLVELQRDFLDYGVKCLKPLNLKKVADIVGLHESTISRATSNKYIQTPQGLYEMKYFFSTGLNNFAGTMTSSESIKKMLQEVVSAEDNSSPLNDQKISEIFRMKGIKISRRTIAKYRDELGIPAVRKRKRY